MDCVGSGNSQDEYFRSVRKNRLLGYLEKDMDRIQKYYALYRAWNIPLLLKG